MQPKISLRLFALVGLAAGLSFTPAQAQTVNVGRFYLGANVGALIPVAISTTQTGTDGTETVTVSGDYNFDAGAAAGGFFGYHLNNWLSVEGDFQYGGADFSSFKGTGTATGPVTASGPVNFSVDGHIDTYTLLANAIVAPFGRASGMAVSPYIGGGAGFTAWDGTINSISANGATAVLNQKHSETDFAADAIVGVDFAVSPQLSIGARYQFLWAHLSNLSSGNGITGSNGDFEGHMITANAAWHF